MSIKWNLELRVGAWQLLRAHPKRSEVKIAFIIARKAIM